MTDNRVSARARAEEGGDTLFYNGLVKYIDIGWFYGLSAVLLEGGKPVANAAEYKHAVWNYWQEQNELDEGLEDRQFCSWL